MNRIQQLMQEYHPIVLPLIVSHSLSRIASSMSLPFLALYLASTTDMSPTMNQRHRRGGTARRDARRLSVAAVRR